VTWDALNLASSEFETSPSPPDFAGLIYRGHRHLISGPPEAAKTLLSWIVGLEALRCGEKVAVVDFEMGPHATRRLLLEMGATLDEVGDVYYLEPDRAPELSDIDQLIADGVTIVVIDAAASAYSVTGLDDSKRTDAEQFAELWIKPLWQRGVTTILIDHVTKAFEGRGRYAIGSERKVGQVDVHLGVEDIKPLSRGGHGLFKVRVHKDRPGFLRRPYVTELDIRSDPDTHMLAWTFGISSDAGDDDGDGFRPTVLMDRVREHLAEELGPVSRNQLEKAIKGKAQWVRRAVDLLIADGDVVENPGPRGSRLLQLATSSHLVPTSSDEVTSDLVRPRPTSSPPTRGDEVDGTKSAAGTSSDGGTRSNGAVDDEEAERLLRDHADIAQRKPR
jgi:AAA domain